MLKAVPAVVFAGLATLRWAAEAALITIPDSVPVTAGAAMSVAVMDCVPAVFKMALKVCLP